MISFFRAPITNTSPQAQVSILQIYNYITSDYAQLATESLRAIADPSEAKRFKCQMFDYVTFSGCFVARRKGGLLSHSGFLCFDIDKVASEEDLQRIKASLVADEKLHTVLLFRSPSGNGLKWVVEVPDRYWLTQITDNRLQITDDSLTEDMSFIDIITQNHKILYERIRHYLLHTYGIVTDHTSDIPRPCYLPHDEDAYYDEPTFIANPASEFLAEPSAISKKENNTPIIIHKKNSPSHDDTENLVREIERRRIDITADYHNWVRIAFALASKHGISGEEFFHRISQFNSGYDPQEAHKVYQSCLRSNNGVVTIGTVVYLMRN